jgi:hypothetical protein
MAIGVSAYMQGGRELALLHHLNPWEKILSLPKLRRPSAVKPLAAWMCMKASPASSSASLFFFEE